MNEIVQEWVDIAEGDFNTAQRELRARKKPNYASACFHAHQIAEKYLKAFMLQQKLHFGKTHNLQELLETILAQKSDLELLRDALVILNQYGVRARYPGIIVGRAEAKEAVQVAKQVRQFVRGRMGLPSVE